MTSTSVPLRPGTLGQLADVTMGQSPPGTSYNNDGDGAPLINGPTEFTERYPVPKQWSTSPTRFCQTGDSLICVRGSSTGRTNIADRPYCIGRGVAAIRASRGNDQTFVQYALAAVVVDLLKMQTGSTFPSIDARAIRGASVLIPSVTEQRRIGEALLDADELIAGLERKIAKKQAIKQGMMQQLLTGRTRLPGYTEPWVDANVADLARVAGGGTPSTRVANYWGGDIPWFTPAEITAKGSGLVSRSERTITSEGLANSSATLLPPGTVLVTSRASIGNCAIAAVPVTTNQGFASMVPKDSRSTWFLYYWTQQNRLELESRAAGSTFLEISARRVAAVPLARPHLDEQEAIGEALRDADRELDVLGVRLAKARAIKTGMVQELLSGRIRLPVREAAA